MKKRTSQKCHLKEHKNEKAVSIDFFDFETQLSKTHSIHPNNVKVEFSTRKTAVDTGTVDLVQWTELLHDRKRQQVSVVFTSPNLQTHIPPKSPA